MVFVYASLDLFHINIPAFNVTMVVICLVAWSNFIYNFDF